MDASDPLVSSTTCLLPGTLGLPVPEASPSKADWALIRGLSGTLKGSSEFIEQSKFVRKGYGDIRTVYQGDGGKAMGATACEMVSQDSSAANCENNQLGRQPAVERKQHRFTMKYPMSKPLPVVDRSVLDTIEDPDEYFAKEVQLNEAEAEIKRLKGENQSKIPLNFDPVVARQRRNPSRLRKSYCFSLDAHAASATMIPASLSEDMKESEISQDDAHATVYEQNDQSVPTNKSAILDSSAKADSFAEKGESDEITNAMASFHSFDGPDKLDFLRKTLGIGEIRVGKMYRRDSILGDTLLGNTAQKNPQAVCALESGVPWSHQARISELANRIFKDSALDKHKDISNDGEREGSPDIVMPKQSLVHDSSDVLTTDETFCAREKVREAPGPSAKSAEHVTDLEPNTPNCDTIDNDPCSRHTISTENDHVPGDFSTIDKSNNESVSSFHHLEDASAEVLANTPGRDVASADIARTSHSYENNIQHQEVVEEDGVVQDQSAHSLEIPLEDVGSQNRSQAPDRAIKNLIADLRTALSPTKENAEKAAQQPKRMKEVAENFSDSLEMPQADFDSENQPRTDDVNTEKNTLLPTKEKTHKAAQRGDNKQQPKRRKKVAAQRGRNKQPPKRGKQVADESRHSLEIPHSDCDLVNQAPTHDVNTEQQTVVMRNASSPEKPKGQKGAQRKRNRQELNQRKSLADAGLEWQSGLRRSKRVRHRPLEQWRGERFVYGRIHKTMVTVVGVKSYSPGEDGKAALKVKSFVPEQYSDIVVKSAQY